jgi:phosphoglycolate phosphatase
MLYRILSATNTDADRTVFVGDGPRDEQAARAAGIDYIMVDWGFTDHENKKVVKSVEGLKKELGVS